MGIQPFLTVLRMLKGNENAMLNKNTLGVKSAMSIRSSMQAGRLQPKVLISAEGKKLLYQKYF